MGGNTGRITAGGAIEVHVVSVAIATVFTIQGARRGWSGSNANKLQICLFWLENIRLTRMAAPSEVTSAVLSKKDDSSTREPRPRSLMLPILVTSRSRPQERLSPRLELQINLLEKQECTDEGEHSEHRSIEQSSELHVGDLEQLRKKRVQEVRRKEQAWNGRRLRVMPSGGGVRLDGGPVVPEGEASMLESDVSSIISISDRLVPSDTEEEDGLHDKKKYRLPDPGKTRLHLRTKEPLSPTTRPVPRSPRRQPTTPTPGTPQAMQSNSNWQSPIWPGYSAANGSSDNVSDGEFVSQTVSRSNSVYTLGRASLQGQLAHLTSLKLPDPNSLAKKISSIPTSTEAAKALSDASEQIRIWINKASEVLNGLNAEDDVEWAAAGGKEGIDDVDKAISRFQNLVEVYVLSIERLQTREDVSTLSADDLQSSVKQMEGIVTSWQKVKDTLKGVKEQVEIAMEWEELWNSVLGEIGQEMEGLNRLVFEMEEKRHQGAGSLLSSKDSIDINELETIVEERPGQGAPLHNHRLSLPPPFSPSSPVEAPPANDNKDDGSLLALFARMQPLRASLDFLPMRLSVFGSRGQAIFPTACLEIERRKDQLELQWKKLEADAESLRRELGEDRWILVFRNAGRQALKMEESITRSYNKLSEAVDLTEYKINAHSFARKAESYETKKVHYGPAIERVLAIIDRGVQDRLTVNGEILRLQSDMRRRWTALQVEMRDIDLVLEDLNNENGEKLSRASISTVMSSERSLASSLVDTPGSSPASSVVGGASGNGSFQNSRTPTPLTNGKTRKTAIRIPSSIPRRIPLTQSGEFTAMPSSSPLATRTKHNIPLGAEPSASHRPRWQVAMKAENRDFRPLSALEPSPYAKTPVAKQTNFLRSSSNPTQTPTGPTPLSRKVSTPNLPSTRTPSTVPRTSMSQNPDRKSALPVPSLSSRKSHYTLRTTSLQAATERRSSLLPPQPKFTDGNEADNESPSHHKRSASSLSSGRRSSMLPLRAKGQAK